jgi:hypothetical protein
MTGGDVVDRRRFLALTGAMLAAPLAADGQQAGKAWRIGSCEDLRLRRPRSRRFATAFES